MKIADLNEAQQEILKSIALTSSRLTTITTYSVTLALGKKSAAVTHSVQLMQERAYLKVEKPERGVAKPLRLTDKGAHAALVLKDILPTGKLSKEDIGIDVLIQNHPYLVNEAEIKELESIKHLMSNRFVNILYYTLAEQGVKLDLYDSEGAFLLSHKKVSDPDIERRYGFYERSVLLETTFRFIEAYRQKEQSDRFDWYAWLSHLEKRAANLKQQAKVILTTSGIVI